MPVRPVDHRGELTAARRIRNGAVHEHPRLALHRADDEHHLGLLALRARAGLVDVPDRERVRLEGERREREEGVLAGLPPAGDAPPERDAEPVGADGLDARRGARRAEDEVEEDVAPPAEEPVEEPDRPGAPDVLAEAAVRDVDVQGDHEESGCVGDGLVSAGGGRIGRKDVQGENDMADIEDLVVSPPEPLDGDEGGDRL